MVLYDSGETNMINVYDSVTKSLKEYGDSVAKKLDDDLEGTQVVRIK